MTRLRPGGTRSPLYRGRRSAMLVLQLALVEAPMPVHRTPGLAVVALALGAALASAATIDGALDPEYGAALAVQTTATSLQYTANDFMYGAELDGAFGYVAGDTLHLLVAGTFNRFYSEPLTFPRQLQLYFDTTPGGQAPLLGAANPSLGNFVDLQGMAGLRFDAGFTPDYWLAGSRDAFGMYFAHYAELPAAGGGAGYFLGSNDLNGDGELLGGTNPFGIRVTLDNGNTAGVTFGCDASSGAGVTTGAEWAIPLAALGSPAGDIKVCALLAFANQGGGWIGNQVLGPVPPGTCTLGLASGVDFDGIAGAQYFVIEHTVPAVRTSWGRVKRAYR